jgi:hypothetical protein
MQRLFQRREKGSEIVKSNPKVYDGPSIKNKKEEFKGPCPSILRNGGPAGVKGPHRIEKQGRRSDKSAAGPGQGTTTCGRKTSQINPDLCRPTKRLFQD